MLVTDLIYDCLLEIITVPKSLLETPRFYKSWYKEDPRFFLHQLRTIGKTTGRVRYPPMIAEVFDSWESCYLKVDTSNDIWSQQDIDLLTELIDRETTIGCWSNYQNPLCFYVDYNTMVPGLSGEPISSLLIEDSCLMSLYIEYHGIQRENGWTFLKKTLLDITMV